MRGYPCPDSQQKKATTIVTETGGGCKKRAFAGPIPLPTRYRRGCRMQMRLKERRPESCIPGICCFFFSLVTLGPGYVAAPGDHTKQISRHTFAQKSRCSQMHKNKQMASRQYLPSAKLSTRPANQNSFPEAKNPQNQNIKHNSHFASWSHV